MTTGTTSGAGAASAGSAGGGGAAGGGGRLASPPPPPRSAASAAAAAAATPAWLRHARVGAPLVLLCVVGASIVGHFTSNRVEAMDARRRRASERTVHLEMAHAAVVGRLGLKDAGADLSDVRPIPRPRDD